MEENRGPYAPNGWVIDIYKYLNSSSADFQPLKELYTELAMKKGRQGKREIAYGDYDRIQLRAVNHFSDYSLSPSQAFDWFGMAQSIFIYPLENDHQKRPFLWDCNQKDVRLDGELKIRHDDPGAIPPKGFFAVSFCYLSDDARSLIAGDYKTLLQNCKIRLQRLINTYNNFLQKQEVEDRKAGKPNSHGQITAEFFGSFSSAELVILWSAEQYTDILYLTDCIRDLWVWQTKSSYAKDADKEKALSFPIFRTTYTTISYPDVNRESMQETGSTCCEVRGTAYVHVAVQEGVGVEKINELRKYIKKALRQAAKEIGSQGTHPKLYSLDCAGEYDIVFSTKSKYLTVLFSNSRSWNLPKEVAEYTNLSIHNEAFNQFVQHTTTRLCYSEGDLPDFARSQGNLAVLWQSAKKEISRVELNTENVNVGQQNFSKTWRSHIINEIANHQSVVFFQLADEARNQFPSVSGFPSMLDQLFVDYIQCCCTSADYLWIHDYHELFQQMLIILKKEISNIQVWASPDGMSARSKQIKSEEFESMLEEQETKRALDDINDLMAALQQQTNHIYASNKLFFKEQDIHFGYTAQHDLVIHSYYGIIKCLMTLIYQNSNPLVQSKLYPLVNFISGNAPTSQMFIEDSFEEYLEMGRLSNRIVVIYMPLDGMSNILHYLPLMIHEVYHYAAPSNRNGRNRLLAKISVYQLLKATWTNLFNNAVKTVLKSRVDLDNQIDSALFEVRTESFFLREIEGVLYNLVNEYGEAIFCGIQHPHQYAGQLSDQVLRSWFKKWMEDWLFCGSESAETSNSAPDLATEYLPSFSDMLAPVLKCVANHLKALKLRLETKGGELTPIEQLFYAASTLLLKQARKKDSFYQNMIETADHLRLDGFLDQLLDQLDEVFPDCAMVVISKMSVAGYLLQIALGLDALFENPRKETNLRFGILIYWMLNRDAHSESTYIEALNKELKEFEALYCAAYRIPPHSTMHDEEFIRMKAERWSDYFREMYSAYISEGQQLGYFTIQPWLTELIENHMLPALQDEDGIGNLFSGPYLQYISMLRMPEGQEQQNKIFEISMNTILNFQSRLTIKSINDIFEKRKGDYSKKRAEISVNRSRHAKSYETSAYSFENLQQLIKIAVEQLCWYRRLEKCPETAGIWYRGVQSSKFAILPSGMIHFAEDASRIIGQCNSGEASYIQCLRHLYEVFRYSSEGTMEQNNPAIYSMVDHLALMQHYSQHTNILDWSEDAYTALYFALEKEITANDKYPSERDKPESCPHEDADAAFYILDPVRFNLACAEIERDLGFFATEGEWRLSREGIPNLSIKDNFQPFREYQDVYQNPSLTNIIPWFTLERPDGRSKGSPITLLDIQSKLCGSATGEILEWHLPRAIYTSKLNPRIKAQSGLFVAFSMLSRPATWQGVTIATDGPNQSLFYYQSIEALQEYYLTMGEKRPFLFKIVIPKNLKRTIGRTLYRFGMSKEKIYPELENRRSR